MTTLADIVNRGLQQIGTRTSVTAAELAANDTNEAKEINLVYENIRDDLLRMAPWDCALKTENLTYITSSPGTPENTSAPTTLWQPGQPTPPWAYEYQYPVDCLRACWIIPATQTGFASGIPITTAVTGGAASFWQGPPVKFKVQTDTFYHATAVAIASGGTGYAAREIITLETGPTDEAPIGAPAQVRVLTVNGSGVILTCELVNSIMGASPSVSGAYFEPQTNPVAQGSTTGSGTGATFNLTMSTNPSAQRVILTNQEFATLVHCRQVTDPNIMDTLFQSAWSNLLAATVNRSLTGDLKASNYLIGLANDTIEKARAVDGNEGLTVNDVTPDWIRFRGVAFTEAYGSAFTPFDWGSLWPTFG